MLPYTGWNEKVYKYVALRRIWQTNIYISRVRFIIYDEKELQIHRKSTIFRNTVYSFDLP